VCVRVCVCVSASISISACAHKCSVCLTSYIYANVYYCVLITVSPIIVSINCSTDSRL
jgi:hypothetical protein